MEPDTRELCYEDHKNTSMDLEHEHGSRSLEMLNVFHHEQNSPPPQIAMHIFFWMQMLLTVISGVFTIYLRTKFHMPSYGGWSVIAAYVCGWVRCDVSKWDFIETK
jgi:hypothetical protein